ncbi:inorganic phosphate transporter [Glutamicibacter mishrai]|uniref:Inorganic phosphate transporter n=1 Tax=Glutamicibacter mishrai TaxID=1775880 RepID=A0A6H0SIU7_9MICC|nr:inorganic phosphate transporter [Glutamicibacter mishrai]QIV87234.1 inorganic phosphate transporter [Glutamicibacter mishrai]
MTLISVLTAIAVVLTLAYAVLNGMRDASTAVAASVRTRALRPAIAVSVAAVFAFIGTMATSGLSVSLVQELNINVPAGVAGLKLLISGLIVAGIWGIYCWWRGLPISSTHALLSALAGGSGAAAIMGDESTRNVWGLLLSSVIIPMVLASIIAYVLSYLLVFPATRFLRYKTSRSVNDGSRAGQAVAAGAVALGLGLQDGQRTGAMLSLVLITGNMMAPGPLTVAIQLTAACALSFGVLLGGWRITYTLGRRLVNFDPLRGMIAQGVAAGMLFVGSLVVHLPLSTTQAVTSGIVGAGRNQAFESVAWRNVNRVLWHWLLTPVVCVIGGAIFALAVRPLFAGS